MLYISYQSYWIEEQYKVLLICFFEHFSPTMGYVNLVFFMLFPFLCRFFLLILASFVSQTSSFCSSIIQAHVYNKSLCLLFRHNRHTDSLISRNSFVEEERWLFLLGWSLLWLHNRTRDWDKPQLQPTSRQVSFQ